MLTAVACQALDRPEWLSRTDRRPPGLRRPTARICAPGSIASARGRAPASRVTTSGPRSPSGGRERYLERWPRETREARDVDVHLREQFWIVCGAKGGPTHGIHLNRDRRAVVKAFPGAGAIGRYDTPQLLELAR